MPRKEPAETILSNKGNNQTTQPEGVRKNFSKSKKKVVFKGLLKENAGVQNRGLLKRKAGD